MADEWFRSSNPPILGRENYNPLGITEWNWNRFCNDYQTAITSNADWINEPIELALHLLGYPNPDGIAPNTVTAYYKNGNPHIVIVVILSSIQMSDTTRASEHRIDLVSDNETWKILWMGFRNRCRRTGNQDWVTTLCP